MTPGFASVAAAVLDHNEHPVAGVAVTYPAGSAGLDADGLAAAVERHPPYGGHPDRPHRWERDPVRSTARHPRRSGQATDG